MNKTYIPLNQYKDGFKLDNINCIDLSIAFLLGQYGYEYYDIYLYIISFYMNWNNNISISWAELRMKICNVLGFEMRFKEVNHENLMPGIKSCVDTDYPCMVIVSYNKVFYLDTYLDPNNTNLHAILIEGIDVEKQIIYAKDNSLFKMNKLEECFLSLNLKNDLLSEMWRESQDQIKKQNSFLSGKVFYFDKSTSSNDMQEVIRSLCLGYSGYNYLDYILNQYNDVLCGNCNDSIMENIRKCSYGSVKIFFTILNEYCANKLPNIGELEQKYMYERNLFLGKLFIYATKGKVLSDLQIQIFKDQIHSSDDTLFTYIKENI